MALDPNEKPDQPIAKFESMLKTDDVYFFDAEDFEDIIHHYLNHGKISLAKKAIQIGLKQHINAIPLKLLQVEVLIFENHFDRAQRMLDELQQLDGNNEEIYIQRANIYSKKDNHEAAIAYLQKALDLSENSFDIYSLLGMEYLFLDDFEMAKQNFMKCLAFDEHDYASLYNVVYCFEFLEDHDGAIAYLNEYLERNPYCQVAWHQVGKQYFSKGMLKEALGAFEFAIISDDSFIGAYFEKGRVLEQLGKYQEAINSYETTITIEDPTSHAFLRMGKCYERLNNDEMAKHYYYKTVHEDPLLDKGWLAITEYYLKHNNYQKALFYINKAINIDGENPTYWKLSACIHTALGQFIEADFSYKQAVELGNYELDTWILWSQAALQNKDAVAALQILMQGLEFYPEDAGLEYHMTGLYLILNEPAKARNHLVEALKKGPQELQIFEMCYPDYFTLDWIQEVIAHAR